MAVIQKVLEEVGKTEGPIVPSGLHASFYPVREKLQNWLQRFPLTVNDSIFNDLILFYLIATKEYLDHRTPDHVFRLILSLHVMQKKLLRAEILFPNQKDLKIRWIPTNLFFPFSSKPVLGCLVGFNLMSRYELFDEENVVLALQKYLPQLRIVKESAYSHASQKKNLKIFYLEIEKKDGSQFTSFERRLLENNLEEKFKNSIQTLSPSIFMKVNEEEAFKHLLVLSQEITSVQDLPQAYITFDHQTGKEIIFKVSLVYVSPMHRFSLKERFFEGCFVAEKVLPVRVIDGRSLQANIFNLRLPRDPALLRSDGSLDFYSARKRVVSLITTAIGEFRDYNGGILLKQQELLETLKVAYPEVNEKDPELMESFFYSITPLEKQVLLSPEILSKFFNSFLSTYQERLSAGSHYMLKVYQFEGATCVTVKGKSPALNEILLEAIQNPSFRMYNLAYNIMTIGENVFFNCTLVQTKAENVKLFIETVEHTLNKWKEKIEQKQVLKIALEYSALSLDPRIGGDPTSGDILHMLFEGLTRFNDEGLVENGISESIEVSEDQKTYTFKLRPSYWNDRSSVSAYDFEYAWKKILAPDFKTSFADHFYHIKNAKEAKEGLCSLDDVGIHVIDDRTLKVDLVRPTPYFLQLTAHQLFSPVHRYVDKHDPQWPYQAEKNYPCNGPFQLKINQPNQGYQFVKNPLYWEADRIKLDQIILTITNSTQALHAFRRKEVDWVGNPFGSWQENYKSGRGDSVLTFPNSWIVWNAFNTTIPPFNNLIIRKAFAYALDRSQITDHSFMPLNPAHSILLPHYREKNQSFPKFNPEKARTLFHEGLKELGLSLKDLPPLEITFLEKGIREYTAECLKQQFEERFGIKCRLKPFPSWTDVFNKMCSGDFQMGLVYFNSWVDDPIYTLNMFKYRNLPINTAKWEHPEFQRLLDLSDQEINPFQRSFHLIKAEEILSQEIPVLPLFYQPFQALVNEDLHVTFRPPSGPFNIGRSFYR